MVATWCTVVYPCSLRLKKGNGDFLLKPCLIFPPWKIFLKPEKGEPLFETSRHVLWQAVVDVQLGDLHLEPLPVRRVLDPDGREVLRGHPGDGGHVVAGCSEEVEVLLVVEVGEPGGENLLVRDSGLEHLLDVQGLDVVRVQAWLDRSSSCDQVALVSYRQLFQVL